MTCLENLERINYPKELVYNLTVLYTFRGKDYYYQDVFKSYINSIVKNTVAKDTIYAAKILGLNVTEARLKYLAKKDSEPKNKDEQVVANLKKVISTIQEEGADFECTSNELLKLTDMIFKGVDKVGYQYDIVEKQENLLYDEKKIYRRELIDKEMSLYFRAKDNLHIEPTQIVTDLYIDMINLQCFTKYNEIIALITLYGLLFKEGFQVFKYVSFFEKFYSRAEQINVALGAAKYGWDTGFPNTAMMNNLLIDMMLDGYGFIESEVQNHEFEKNLKKVDSVESAIMKLEKIFTKEQIKTACPNLSDSTINRALKRLKDEGKISSNGTGRSATWMKLVEDEILVKGTRQQMSLFDLQEMADGI